MPKAELYKKWRAEGRCVWCGGDCYVDPATLKKRVFCFNHLLLSRQTTSGWRKRNPDKRSAQIARQGIAKAERRRSGGTASRFVVDYLHWLYGELQRLRDLDAIGDVRK